MAQFDLPLDELWNYRPEVYEPADFDRFWSDQLAASAAHARDVSIEPVEGPVTSVRVFDVGFTGHGGDRIAAWLLLPHEIDDAAPCVVEFIGYNGGRGHPIDWLKWSGAGFPHLVVDSRGQGGGWRSGATADPQDGGEAGARGFLTSGLSSPDNHYYSRLFVDVARSVDVLDAVADLNGRQVVFTGGSQGGALALAAANLTGRAAAVLADVPFLAHFRRAVSVTDESPYSEIAVYCKTYPDRVDAVFETLSYFDVVNHGRRVTAPALFSVGLFDEVTPPSTVFAVYANYLGDAEMAVYEFNGHEGGGAIQFERQIDFIRSRVT